MRFWFLSILFWWAGVQSVAQNVQVYQKNNLFGLADGNGKAITEAIYSDIQVGSDYSIIRIWNKAQAVFLTGTIDSKGNTIIEPTYIDLKRDGLRLIACKKVTNSFRYGLISSNGKEVIPITFSSIESLGSMRYQVENEEKKFAIYTDTGTNITGFTLENLHEVKPNLIQFTQNNLYGLLDRQGNIVREARYAQLSIMENKVVATLPRQWELLSLNDFKTISIDAEKINFSKDANLIIQKEANATLLFSKTNQAISKAYPSIKQSEQESIYYAKEEGKTILLNANGNPLQNAKGDSIIVNKNFAWIYRNKLWQAYTFQNNSIISNRFENIRKLGEYFVGEKQNYEGLVDKAGEEIIPCVYDSILDVKENLVVVKIKNLYGIIDEKEKWLLPLQPFPVKIFNQHVYIQEEGKLK
nr:WG repeat-containing protein [Cyclobacteriaceae bacterium]